MFRKLLSFLTFGLYKPKPKRDFPSWASGVCFGELNEAERIIKEVGVHKIEPQTVRVKFIGGEKQFGKHWAVRGSGSYTGWVLGECSGPRITIVMDPNRMGDPSAIDKEVLRHEFAHHWTMTNGHGAQHHPCYDGRFFNWAWARKVYGKNRLGLSHPRQQYDFTL